jgi:hypothetical protein
MCCVYVCMDMVWCNVKQCAFLYKLCMKYGANLKLLRKDCFWWIKTYLNSTECVCVCARTCMHRNNIFSTSYNTGKFVLIVFMNQYLARIRKSFSAGQWVMQFLLRTRKWQLHSSSSSNDITRYIVSNGKSISSRTRRFYFQLLLC